MWHKIVLFFILIIAILLLSCEAVSVEKLYQKGMVVTASPIASDIGLSVLKDGGNAFDAAVAVGFVLAVCFPEAGNIGGGGFAVTYSARDGAVRTLDFRETAPGTATADMFLDDEGNVIPDASLVGALASGVPGTVYGLYELWKNYGTGDWYNLVEPALMLADTGFIVDADLAGSLNAHMDGLRIFPETEKIFSPDGTPLAEGDRFIQKDLAGTLRKIALDSIDGFYSGTTADLIVAASEKYDGLISRDDLKSYRPVWRSPIHFTFDSLDIYSMPPPSSGGVIMGMILKILEPYDFYRYTPESPEYIHLFTEACRLAYAERAVHLGDPDFVDNPIDELLNPVFLDTRRKLIDPERANISSEIGTGIPEITDKSESTTHFSIIDEDGNAVSLTYTINTPFGSKLVVDKAGFLLNNEMDDFALKAGVPNYYGLIGSQANAVAPGKRMLSSMSPTIVIKKGKPFIILGSPGGSKIITAISEALLDITRFGLNPAEAVSQARFHHQWLPDTLYLELGGFDINVKQALITRGHNIKERNRYSEIQLIYINDNDMKIGASDPRGFGKAAGY